MHNIARQKHNIARQKHNIARQKRNIARQMHNIARQKHNIARQKHNIARQMHYIFRQLPEFCIETGINCCAYLSDRCRHRKSVVKDRFCGERCKLRVLLGSEK